MDLKFKIPSFGEWLSRKPLISQVFFHTYLQAGAIIVWILAMNYIPQLYPLPASLNLIVSAAPALIYLELYRIWDTGNKQESATLYNFNPKLQWSLENAPDEMLSSKVIRTLKEDVANSLYFFHIPSITKMKDPINKVEFRDIILISRRPFKETFKETMDGYRSFKGSLSIGPAIPGWWVWLTDFKNINQFTDLSEDVISEYRVFYNAIDSYYADEEQRKFKVKKEGDPRIFFDLMTGQDGDAIQKQIGLGPRNHEITTETVLDAIKSLDNQNAVKVKLELRDEQSLNRKLVENYEDASMKAVAKIDTFWENDRVIRKPPSIFEKINLKWIAITVIILAILYMINQRWTPT